MLMTHRITTLVDLGLILLASSIRCGSLFQDADIAGSGRSNLSVILTVGKQTVCAEKGESLNITCSLTLTDNVNQSLDGWSLSWHSEGRRLNANEIELAGNNSVVTSCLCVHVSWSERKVFTCVANRSSGATNDSQQSMNSSVIVHVTPRPINKVGLRFIESAQGQIVEAFWRPTASDSVIYTLKYCLEKELNPICPHYRSVESECLFRYADYYRVPNTSGLICYASINHGPTAPTFLKHELYIASERAGCVSKSSVSKFELATIPLLPTESTLVLIPHPVINFQVMATKQRVVYLNWSNPSFVYGRTERTYAVDYNCSKNDTIYSKETLKFVTKMNLYAVDFHPYHPYDLCRFCVKARLSNNAIYSKSVCKVTRLHEDIPAGAPKITCWGDDCKTSSNAIERNVTITWVLPPREDWNGILINVKVIIYGQGGNNHSKNNKVSDSNLTKGETVLRGLAVNTSYVVQMVACNKEGCGERGKAVTISALPAATPITFSKQSIEKSTTTIHWWYWAPGILVLFLVVGFLVCLRRYYWMNLKKARRGCLPSICEPKDYDNVESSVRAVSRHYCELDVGKLECVNLD